MSDIDRLEDSIRRGAKDRGLRIYTMFRDSYGSLVRVQQSSAAGRPHAWIFCSHPRLEDMAPHITVAQAKRVRDALDRFVRAAQPPRSRKHGGGQG